MSHKKARRELNRLAYSKSPYLQLHASDPVDWYPWGEEAFRKAREEDKPIMLSIGYLSCHWCHVMQRESFKNKAISEILNQHFVPVKVDREERPDIDAVYMRAVILMTGQGGWPLTVFLTPDLKPFFGGTYFPPTSRHNLPGFKEVLLAVKEAWDKRREEVLKSADNLFEMISQSPLMSGETEQEFSMEAMDSAFEQLVMVFDDEFGGVRGAPKFPMPTVHLFLLRYWRLKGVELALKMVERTLGYMFSGGIYDHACGGFHRYAVDRTWSIPHFEKMLYDNAMLLRLYSEAWVVTKSPLFLYVAEDIARWLVSELKSPEGGFYSSLSAESGGVEGGYYLYSWSEVVEALGEDVAKLLGCSPAGNFEGGLNVVRLPVDLRRVTDVLGMGLTESLRYIRTRLEEIRRGKVRPEVDEKIIASWNGLAIGSLAYAAAVTSDRSLLNAAVQAADFVLGELYPSGSLKRYWRDGPGETDGLLEDHALLGCGLLDLYEWGGDARFLDKALSLASDIIEKFSADAGGFYDSPPRPDTPVRPVTIEDHAYPSGYSAAIQLLSKLYLLTGDESYLEASKRALKAAWEKVQMDPIGCVTSLSSVPYVMNKGGQLVVAVEDDAWPVLTNLVKSIYEPYVVVSAGRSDALQELWEGKTALGGEVTYYFCKGFRCLLPTTRLEELEKVLKVEN